MRSRAKLVGLGIALLLVARRLPAPLSCYSEGVLPLVYELRATDAGGLVAQLGGKWAGSRSTIPTIRYTDEKGWTEGDPIEKPQAPLAEACPPIFRQFNIAESSDSEWKSTTSVVCAASGRYVFGGASFYDGEGISGTGAIARYDTETGILDVRHPRFLRDLSIDHIAAEGQVLWFGTTQHFECVGDPFARGLVRYDWDTAEIETYEESDDGPLGFVVHGLVLTPARIWVATDIGISMLDRASGTWRHWIPDGKPGAIRIREITPAKAFRMLFASIDRERLMNDSYSNQLVEGLARFRPRLLREILGEQPASSWRCPETQFLATRMPDFATFQKRLLHHLRPGSEEYRCAVDSFGETQHPERAWRTFLLAEVDSGRVYPQAGRFFRDDPDFEKILLEHFDEDSARVLPMLMGERAVPVLLRELGKNEPDVLESALIVGLERASHQRFLPGGSARPLPAGSDRPWYAAIDGGEDWFNSLPDEQQQNVIAAWLRWGKERQP